MSEPIKVAPHPPAAWVDTTRQPTPAFYQYQVALANAVNNAQNALAAVPDPTGGAVVDVQARAAIAAIIAAFTQG